MILRPDQDRFPKIMSKAKSGKDTVFSAIVSSVLFRGCLSVDGFYQFKVE